MTDADLSARPGQQARRLIRTSWILIAAVAAALLSAPPADAAVSAAPAPSPRPVIDAPPPPTDPFPTSPGSEVVVDNVDPGFSSSAGGVPWATSSGMSGFLGTDYAYAFANSGATARWTPDVQTTGWYGVYAWMPDGVGKGRATAAKFTVNSADATTETHSVDQSVAARGEWLFLGNHRFDAGTGGYVELAAGVGGTGTVIADAIRLGPTQQESIVKQLDRAKAAGSTTVTIAPGTYKQAATLNLKNYPGMTINADGAWLVLTNPAGQALYIPSNGVTVEGLTITYETMPYTQGRVRETSAEAGGSMVVEISTGFRKPANPTGRVITWDADLRLQHGFADGGTFVWEDQAAGLLRVSGSTNPWLLSGAKVGDIVTIGDITSHTQAISVDGTDVTLRDVILRGAPAMGLMNAVGGGNLHLDGFQLIPPAKPQGATEEPIMSSVHDGLQFQSVKKGPTIENSLFVNAGDDTFSNPGVGPIEVVAVDAADPTIVTLRFEDDVWRRAHTGDRLQQWLGDVSATITALRKTDDPTDAKQLFTATLDVPSPWTVGTKVTSPDRMGADWVFRNNRVDSSGRGLLVKAPNGEITDNWIRGANAISVASEIWSNSHANAGGHLVIARNEIYSSPNSAGGVWNGCQRGAVSFEADESLGRTGFLSPDIEVTDNTFVDIRGLNLLIANAANVSVTGNQFLNSHRVWAPRDNRCDIVTTSVITVMQSDGVHFADNTIDWMGPYSTQPVTVEAGTSTNISGLPGGVALLNEHATTITGHHSVLTNAHSALRLAESASGAVVQQGAGLPAQTWRLEPTGTPGVVAIVHHASGDVLTANATTAAVTLTGDSGQPTQRWRVLDLRDGLVRILNQATGKALGTNGEVLTDGAPIGQYPAAGSKPQTWALADVTGVRAADPAAGTTQVEAPPSSVVAGAWERNGTIRVFAERLGQALAAPVTVGGITIPAGTRVNVHYVHADRIGSDNVRATFTGSLLFDGDVLAVASSATDLQATSAAFGSTGTTYSTHVDQGLEYDDEVDVSGRVVDLALTVYGGSDAVRVFTTAPSP
ncbi:RICIN domain-containing protein [Agromyces aureus]|uniref:Uncharacterized protein n=1 Tax=Agromyces aureus TaxID=453304 RepID=A0A191WCZ5_9MICO|nr:RICIN domain-containing protein [Agromyces aureus]ANJ26140.1 hypothetical protein ATC03_04750 [Agromyces aureus]